MDQTDKSTRSRTKRKQAADPHVVATKAHRTEPVLPVAHILFTAPAPPPQAQPAPPPQAQHLHACDSALSREEQLYLSQQPEGRRALLIQGLRQATTVDNNVPLRFKVLESKLPNKEEILVRLSRGESHKYETWVNAALSLPIGRYTLPPRSVRADIPKWLHSARKKMDAVLYGQNAAKDEALRTLCKWACTGTSSMVLGLHGLPGIGKTTFGQHLASVMQRPFISLPLGGLSDAAHLLGHSYTYEGAICGRVAEAARSWKCMDGVLFFDEVDKVGKGRSDDVTNVLINLTDKETNGSFRDKYFAQIPLDFSRAIFVFSYNDADAINPVLLDRMHQIKFDAPTLLDKIAIARKHLLPRTLMAYKMTAEQVIVSDEVIRYIINEYTDESGVRALDRALERLVATVLVAVRGSTAEFCAISLDEKIRNATPVEITPSFVESVMGAKACGAGRDSKSCLMYS